VQRHDAQRADPCLREPFELCIADAGLHHRDAFRGATELLHRIQGNGVVVGVGVGLHDDHALEAELLL
jgi:hypothetical protein